MTSLRGPELLAPVFVLIWSSGYVVGSIATEHAPALAIIFWRLIIGGALLAAISRLPRGRRGRTRLDRRGLLGAAAVGALIYGVQFGGVYLGLSEGMPAGSGALAVSVMPLLIAVVQAASAGERLAAAQWLGSALGVLGVVVALSGRLAGTGGTSALLWTVLGVLGFAAGTLLTPRLVPAAANPFQVASVECLAAAVVVTPWALLTGGIEVPASGPAYGAAAWLTLVNAVGGAVVLLSLVRTRGATRASSLLYVVPAVTALAAWPVLGQPLTVATVAGLAISGVGVLLVSRRPRVTRVPTAVACGAGASTMDR